MLGMVKLDGVSVLRWEVEVGMRGPIPNLQGISSRHMYYNIKIVDFEGNRAL